MSAEGGDAPGFEKLKALFVGDAVRRIDDVETQVRKIDAYVGDATRLEQATADILVDAFRAAEVKRHRELAIAIAPLVVAAIRSEIKNSKDMMVEALYPITGRLVTAAVANAFRELVESINSRIDALASAHVWRLRVRALMTGRSMAEVALAEADAARLKRALLLERGSGRLLASWPHADTEEQADLASGLIAAITEFAATVYADTGGELRNLDLGSTKVFLRASARVIVAGEFTGELSSDRERRLDEAFLAIVEAHERDEEGFTAEAMGGRLNEALLEEPAKSVSKTPILLVTLALAGLAVWFSIDPVVRAWREHVIRDAFATAMAKRSALAEFPLRLDIDHADGRVVVRGLTADEGDPQAVVDAIADAARPYRVERDVKVVVLAPRGPDALADGAKAGADLQTLGAQMREARAALAQLQDAPQAKLQRLVETFAIFFTESDAVVDPAAAANGLDELAALLKATDANLRVVGYGDETGSATGNRYVSRKRAEKVAAMLTERGVAPEKLVVVPRSTLPPIADQGQNAARNRRVVFERPYVHEFDVR